MITKLQYITGKSRTFPTAAMVRVGSTFSIRTKPCYVDVGRVAGPRPRKYARSPRYVQIANRRRYR